MSDYMDEYMRNSATLYNAIIKKCVDGESLTDSELRFVLTYRRDLKSSTHKSTFQKLLEGFQGIRKILAESEPKEE